MEKNLCFNLLNKCWDQLGVMYYELLKPSKTIIGALYRTQLIRALKEKPADYFCRHDKIILLHDNARLHVEAPVKTYLGILNRKSYPTYPFRLSLVLVNGTWSV